jgi:hypothetical protein
VISEAIVRSAIERRESRGSQWRFDHLEQEVAFGKVNFVTRRGADSMEVVGVPLDPLPERLRPLLERSRFYDAAKLPKGYLTESSASDAPGAPAVEPRTVAPKRKRK